MGDRTRIGRTHRPAPRGDLSARIGTLVREVRRAKGPSLAQLGAPHFSVLLIGDEVPQADLQLPREERVDSAATTG